MESFAEKIANDAQEIKFHGKCSWFKCKKQIKGTGYADPLLAALKFVFCSRDCIRKDLEYVASEEAIWDSAEPFL